MYTSNLASAVVLAGFASSSLWTSPSSAQELPRQPTTTIQPTTPIAPPSPVRPPVTIKCANGYHYKLTTGSDLGVCKVYVDRGRVSGGFCTDGTNSALQTCSTGCKEVAGSGACEKQDPSTADDTTSGGA
jgi:hypothetical protein